MLLALPSTLWKPTWPKVHISICKMLAALGMLGNIKSFPHLASCMLFLFGWPPCQRSDMISMEVSQLAYDMIHYISGLFGCFYVCEIYINLIWYLYLFILTKFRWVWVWGVLDETWLVMHEWFLISICYNMIAVRFNTYFGQWMYDESHVVITVGKIMS